MNMQIDFKRHSKSQFLSPEQIEEFGAKVDAIRREVMDDLGKKTPNIFIKSATLSAIAKLPHVAC